MRARRRRSFAAVVGRMRIESEQQEAQLLAPSTAARILDLLLCLPSHAQREGLLPDCCTPPPPPGAPGEEGSGANTEDEETDQIWCTPLQLLNEINGRISHLEGAGGGGWGQQRQALAGGGHGLSREAYVAALQQLRAAVESRWLESLPDGRGGKVGQRS